VDGVGVATMTKKVVAFDDDDIIGHHFLRKKYRVAPLVTALGKTNV